MRPTPLGPAPCGFWAERQPRSFTRRTSPLGPSRRAKCQTSALPHRRTRHGLRRAGSTKPPRTRRGLLRRARQPKAAATVSAAPLQKTTRRRDSPSDNDTAARRTPDVHCRGIARSDSHKRSGGCEPDLEAVRVRFAEDWWCERGDSNPHGSPRWNLNPVRLPVPPRSHRQAV